jgi:hypothetical protein
MLKRTPEKKMSNRSAEVIRQAIIDEEIMNCLTPQDLSAVLARAVDNLTPSDVRGFIYRCISNREIGKGLIMADRAIEFALEMQNSGEPETYREIVGAAVGTISIMSANVPAVKEKLKSLLHHPYPEIVVTVIENLGHTSDLDNFNQVADLMLQSNSDIAFAAADYVEACARDAAFRKRRDLYVIESSSEEFLRSALLRLERIYHQVKGDIRAPRGLARRLVILVAMMYNEVLDSMDWRRFKKEQVDARIYYALEQHLHLKIGPFALPYLFTLLETEDVEDGIRQSALLTLGRLSKQADVRNQMVSWLPSIIGEKKLPDVLVSLAICIRNACLEDKPFSVLMCLPSSQDFPTSIVPRSAGAPLRRDDEEEI